MVPEALRVGVTGRDGPDRAAYRRDPEELVDRLVDVEREVLRQVADVAGDAEVAGGRLEDAGDQPEQGGLAGPVDATGFPEGVGVQSCGAQRRARSIRTTRTTRTRSSRTPL
ncbi:hypothetical protein JCM10369A_03250 [Nocardioides pyridinolyticus]